MSDVIQEYRRLVATQPPRRSDQRVAFIYARASSDPSGRGRSVERQVEDCWKDCERHGWYVGGIFVDNDRSASSYATKEREDYDRMFVEMQRGGVDYLVCWEASRATRDVRTYLDLSDMSRERGVLWCFNGTVYDMANADDEFRTLLETVLGHREVRKLAERVKAGIAKAARDGKPHGGPTPYGYVRVYDSRTREFVGQEIDEEPREATTAAGGHLIYNRADVVREMIRRLAGGDSVHNLTKSLRERGIPSPSGGEWHQLRIRSIALNPAYAGKRVHQGKVIGDGCWEPIVDLDLLAAVRRRLEDPKRRSSRDNKAVHLLSYLAVCGGCGVKLGIGIRKPTPDAPTHATYRVYSCIAGKRCTSIKADKLDAYVESVIIAKMSDPATLDWLVRPDDTEAQKAAEAAASAREELASWQAEAAAGRIAPADFAVIAGGIRERISALEEQAIPEYVPMALRGLIGDRAAEAWDALSIATQRDVIRSIMGVELWTVGCGKRTFDPSRVKITWLLDPVGAAPTPGGKRTGRSAPEA